MLRDVLLAAYPSALCLLSEANLEGKSDGIETQGRRLGAEVTPPVIGVVGAVCPKEVALQYIWAVRCFQITRLVRG